MNLPEFSVRQTVLVNVLFFVCMLAGGAALLRTPIEAFPDISFNIAVIRTPWTGASSEEIERLVTTRIEEELVDLDGIKEIRSESRANMSQILVEFQETLSEAEYNAAFNDTRAAVDRVPDLPQEAEEPTVVSVSTKMIYPDIKLAVIDRAGVGELSLRQVAKDLQARLENRSGVAAVHFRSEHELEVRVLVDRDAAAQYDLDLTDIVGRIRGENLNIPAGTFESEGSEISLRATGDFQSTQEILETVIRDAGDGTQVRLSDVARVESGLEKRRFYELYNGQPALILGVAKEDHVDVRDISASVRSFIEQATKGIPAGIELRVNADQSLEVKKRLGVVFGNLVVGMILVMALLWLTIGFRNGLLTIVALPFSFLTAIALFPLFGQTIDQLGMIAMLLVSGMLVDDAIIVMENIYRRIEEGEDVREAVLNGSREVLWPVVAAVATTCAAFAPLLFMEGTAGKFMIGLPRTVLLCLTASLIECLLVLPAHYMDFGSRRTVHGGEGDVPPPIGAFGFFQRLAQASNRLTASVDRGLQRLRTFYQAGLDVVLGNRRAFASLVLGVLILALGGARHLDVKLFPPESPFFFVLLEAPPDSGLEQTREIATAYEKLFEEHLGDDIEDYVTTVGSAITGGSDSAQGNNLAMTTVRVKDRDDLWEKPEKVQAAIAEELAAFSARNPGAGEIKVRPPRDGPPVGRPIAMRIVSDDYELAKRLSLDAQAYLRTLPGVMSIEDNLKVATSEYQVQLDEDRTRRLGLSFEDVALSLRAANDGVVASQYRDPRQGEEADIRVMLEPRYRTSIQDILQTQLRAPTGQMVRLGDVADLRVSRGFREYAHHDRERAVTVYADVTPQIMDASAVNLKLQNYLQPKAERYPQVSLYFGGEFQLAAEAESSMFSLMPIALLLIYMILAALFRSYLQPLVVVAAIPFGFLGVLLGAHLLSYTVNMPMLYAAMGLMGVVVNDSLVMVDFINRARATGVPLRDAVRESGAKRFRPILLTTFTTTLALLPMALGIGGGSKTFGPFAATLVFGLIVGMIGTLFAVPMFYTILIDLQERFANRFGGSAGGTGAESAPVIRIGRKLQAPKDPS